ncbi:MAG: YceI family protein [Saprospiraceae bacterium]|nr:YceI family protein [Saprospiraceae bacterium]
MRNRLFLLLLLGLCFTAQLAFSQTFIKDKSTVTFRIKNAGFWVNGSFSDFSMQAQFNPASLSGSGLSGSLSVNSISTNNKKRDEHLLSEDYFEAEQFPTITLTSSTITRAGEGYLWQGTLKIKETEKSVSIPFQVEEKADHLLLMGEFTINRIDYGVGKKSWLMNQKVYIQLQCAVPKTS